MPRFWSYISNEKYIIGCTGQTVYLYDDAGVELAKFKDLTYAYTSAFSPKGDIFVVKSTEGWLAVYSIEKLCLIKKFRFSKVNYSQDDNFCFSPDGEKFYNIERHIKSYKTALSVYNTSDFSLEKRLFLENTNLKLDTIEYNLETDNCFLMGFKDKYFVAKLYGNELKDIQHISDKEHTYYHGYKNLEIMGFTEKAKEWSALKYNGYDLSDIENKKHSLSKLWEHYSSINK